MLTRFYDAEIIKMHGKNPYDLNDLYTEDDIIHDDPETKQIANDTLIQRGIRTYSDDAESQLLNKLIKNGQPIYVTFFTKVKTRLTTAARIVSAKKGKDVENDVYGFKLISKFVNGTIMLRPKDIHQIIVVNTEPSVHIQISLHKNSLTIENK